jgi:hypothetical protein
MKKLLVLLSSLFIFAGLFTGCPKEAPQTTLTEEEEYTNFYNKIAAHTWVDNNTYTYGEISISNNKIQEDAQFNLIRWTMDYVENGVPGNGSNTVLKKDDLSKIERFNANKYKYNSSKNVYFIMELKNNKLYVEYQFQEASFNMEFNKSN